jgi:hypothetical protein
MGWSQLKNEDTYLSLNSDWNPLLTSALPTPTFPGISNPLSQSGFGWTYSQMGYLPEAKIGSGIPGIIPA